jgi:hypothetical protein
MNPPLYRSHGKDDLGVKNQAPQEDLTNVKTAVISLKTALKVKATGVKFLGK